MASKQSSKTEFTSDKLARPVALRPLQLSLAAPPWVPPAGDSLPALHPAQDALQAASLEHVLLAPELAWEKVVRESVDRPGKRERERERLERG